MGGLELLWSALRSVIVALASNEAVGVWCWTIGLVLAWSGVVKVRSPERAALALVDFRVVRRPRRAYGRALALGELALGVALATAPIAGGPYASVVGGVATLLFLAFTFALARALYSSERFACFCFGEADAELSIIGLLRAGLLAVMGIAIAALAADLSPASWREIALQVTTAAALVGIVAGVAALSKIRAWTAEAPADQGPVAA